MTTLGRASLLIIALLCVSPLQLAEAQNNIGTIYGNSGIITQGQIGNNTINVGPQSRLLESPDGTLLKQQILRDFPRDKPIGIVAIAGDAESMQLATQIHAFMKANGFAVQDSIAQAIFTTLVKGLRRQNEADGSVTFIVGANLP